MWNLAGFVFMGFFSFVRPLVFVRIQFNVGACSCLLDFVVQIGRGRHSGFFISGVTNPLRAYVEPSRVCLYGLFLF